MDSSGQREYPHEDVQNKPKHERMVSKATSAFGSVVGAAALSQPNHQAAAYAILRGISARQRHICVRHIRTSSAVRRQDSEDMDEFEPFPHFATSAIHSGQEPEQWTSHAVIPPISLSTTFKQFEPAKFAVSDTFQRPICVLIIVMAWA